MPTRAEIEIVCSEYLILKVVALTHLVRDFMEKAISYYTHT